MYKGEERIIYRCSRYVNQGKEQCSTHCIKQETLEQVILADIKNYAQAAVKDESRLINRLMSASDKERVREQSAKHQTMTKFQKRIDVIDKMVKQLFEEKVTGSLPDAMFRKMMTDYEQEQKDLELQIRILETELQATNETESNILRWMKLIKECLSLESLNRETTYQLISNITVSEKTEVNGKKHQNILIQYNFVGCLD